MSKESADEQLSVYRELYRATPTFEKHFRLTDESAYAYCAMRSHFVLVLAYTTDRRILVERSFKETDLCWSLLGGALRPDRHEDFIEAAGRIAQYNLPSLELADIEPLAFLKNTFEFGAKTCEHHGIAFVGRIRSDNVVRAISHAERTRAHLIGLDMPPGKLASPHNAEVFQLAVQYLDEKDTTDPFHDHEVSENIKYRGRYKFHDGFVKPAMKLASKFSYPYSLTDLNRRINELILEKSPRSLIDVACGENSLCADLARVGAVPIIVGNDVSWSQIELIERRPVGNRSALLYTNHDATDLPFQDDTFDVALCKNVMHHMPSRGAVSRLVGEASRIAKRAVIIEVMDPDLESPFGRIRHKYYLNYLHDAAVHFYSTDEFKDAVDMPGSVHFGMPTIRGVYNFAIIDK